MSKVTPWAIICHKHGRVYLTQQQYDKQMNIPDAFWLCPVCGDVASWDDDNYEKHVELLEQEAEDVQDQGETKTDVDPRAWVDAAKKLGAKPVEF